MRLYRDLNAAEAANLVCQRMPLALTDQAMFKDLLTKGLQFRHTDRIENRIKLFDGLRLFSLEMFEALISGGSSYNTGPVRYLWDCLERAGVVVASTGALIPALATHTLNSYRLAQLVRTRTLPNIFQSPANLATYYSGSLVAVDVIKEGVERRGSGFVVQSPIGPAVLTCRHNVDPDEGVTEVRLSDVKGNGVAASASHLSDKIDAALLVLDEPIGDCVPIFMTQDVETFDEVFTLGFPAVPLAHSTLVGHRGEVNGRAELYLDNSSALLISNIVSPGSSGCPVLTREGLCVGMTIRWLESNPEAGGARFSAALPSDALEAFLHQVASS